MSLVVIIRHEVADFDSWLDTYYSYDDQRIDHGQGTVQILRDVENPNKITIIAEWESMEGFEAFGQAVDLQSVMQGAGVLGPPDIFFTTVA